MKFSVLFFGADAAGPYDHYQLVLDVVRLADRRGLTAVWFPERHFTVFGGPYPNPVVLAAAAATITERIRLRAGSVILPLHDPVRVAEEWAVVDNLSRGRVEISFGSGWNVNDFVLAPEAYADRRSVMDKKIATVRSLWRGDPLPRLNGAGRTFDVQTLPRPVQPELPVWLTAQSEPTFAYAGEQGFSVLTNLNFNTSNQLAERVAHYRAAADGAGRESGCVALMVHAFLGSCEAAVRAAAGPALRRYLGANLDLRSDFAAGKTGSGSAQLISAVQIEAMISRGLDRLFDWAGLLGSPQECERRVRAFADAGVDELACLVDFGTAHDATLESLELLADLAERFAVLSPAQPAHRVGHAG